MWKTDAIYVMLMMTQFVTYFLIAHSQWKSLTSRYSTPYSTKTGRYMGMALIDAIHITIVFNGPNKTKFGKERMQNPLRFLA